MAEIGRASVVFETVGADKVRQDVASLNKEMNGVQSSATGAADATSSYAAAGAAAGAATAALTNRMPTLSGGLIKTGKAFLGASRSALEYKKASNDLARADAKVAEVMKKSREAFHNGANAGRVMQKVQEDLGDTLEDGSAAALSATVAQQKYRDSLKNLVPALNDVAAAGKRWIEIGAKAGAVALATAKVIDFLSSSGDRAAAAMSKMADRVGELSSAFRDLDFGSGSDNPFDAIRKQADDARKSFFDSTQALRKEAEEFMRQGPGVLDAAIGLFTTSNYEAQADAYNRQLEVLERRASAVSKRIEEERKASLLTLKDQTLEDLYRQRVDIQIEGLDELEQAEARMLQNRKDREKEIQELQKRGQFDIAEATRKLAAEEEKRSKDQIDAIKERQAAEEEARRKQERNRQQREAEANLAKQLDLLRKTIEGQAKLQSDIRDQMISLNNTFTNFSPSIEKIGEYAGRIY